MLVDRERELEVLSAALARACSGVGQLVLVAGEPGMGKTCVAAELGARATQQGARVLWGHCWEAAGAPALWPWLQVFRSYAQAVEAGELRDMLRHAKEPLRLLVPEWWPEEPGEPRVAPLVALDSPHARFALLDAATEFVTAAAARRPLVLILDDLHAADVASLLLLRSLAAVLPHTAVLVVAAFREAELRRRPDAAALVADLTRLGVTLPLHGLRANDIERMLRLHFGVRVGIGTSGRIEAITGGNPFLIEEVARLLGSGLLSADAEALEQLQRIERGRLLPAPGYDLISERLDLLQDAGREVLRVASLIGQEFDVRLLVQATNLADTDTLHYLREACADGLLLTVSAGTMRYRFRHALIREALAAELSAADRARLHHAIGEAVEGMHYPLVDPYLDALSFHFVQALPVGDWARAVRYATAAGERAWAVLAYEDAALHYEGALEALGFASEPLEAQRAELLLALGTCRQKAGDLNGARAAARQAADIGRALQRPDMLGRAALTYSPWTSYGRTDDRGIPLLEEAAAAQPDTDSSLRAQLFARLAHTLDSAGARYPRAHLLALSHDAVEMARRLGEPHALARALFARRWVDWNPASSSQRWRLTDDLLAIAQRLQDRELAVLGEGWRFVDRLEAGDPAGVDVAMRRHAALASELRQPEHLWWSAVWSAMRAVMEGRFAEAEDLIGRAVSIGEAVEAENAYLVGYLQLSQMRFDRGEVAETIQDFRGIVDARREVLEGDPVVRCRFAQFFAEIGQLAEVEREFEPLAADDFAALTLDMRYAANLASLALACAALNDERRAVVLYDRLRPATGHNLLFGPALISAGPSDRFLGLLAAATGRLDLARPHFEAALAMSRRLGWLPLVARTQCDYAAMLLRLGSADDRDAVRALLRSSIDTAGHLGMKRLAQRARELSWQAGGQAPPAEPAGTAQTNSLQRDGDHWAIIYAGARCRVRHSHGLHYLAELLRVPGREIHALELVALVGGAPAGAAGLDARRWSDAGEVLDAQARAAYRERLRELEAELADAEAANDLGRLARARHEREVLEAELGRALALGRRARRSGSVSERARLNVTRAIKTAIAHISAVHPRLGRHLVRHIRTGTTCVYLPDPATHVPWKFLGWLVQLVGATLFDPLCVM